MLAARVSAWLHAAAVDPQATDARDWGVAARTGWSRGRARASYCIATDVGGRLLVSVRSFRAAFPAAIKTCGRRQAPAAVLERSASHVA